MVPDAGSCVHTCVGTNQYVRAGGLQLPGTLETLTRYAKGVYWLKTGAGDTLADGKEQEIQKIAMILVEIVMLAQASPNARVHKVYQLCPCLCARCSTAPCHDKKRNNNGRAQAVSASSTIAIGAA